jgi:hypothetical protein
LKLRANAAAVLKVLALLKTWCAIEVHIPALAAVIKHKRAATSAAQRITLRTPFSSVNNITSLNALDIIFLNARFTKPRETTRTGIAGILDRSMASPTRKDSHARFPARRL